MASAIRRYVEYRHDYTCEGSGGYTAADLASYRQLGIGLEEAVELKKRRDAGDDTARRIVNARAYGVERADIDEMLAVNAEALEEYVLRRQDGFDHRTAVEALRDWHVHRATVTTVEGGFDPVLGTGEQTVHASCRCGHPMGSSTTRRNWSGD